MNGLVKAALVGALLLGSGVSAFAVERGGTVTYGRYADSLLLDPVYNEANVDIWVLSNIYDTLILPSADGKGLEPGLATQWSVSSDGLAVSLTLRDGITFSDGSPITPEDVRWSIERAAAPDNGEWSFLLGAIEKVEITGDRSVVLRLKHTDPAILSALTVFNAGIMPEKLYQNEPGASDGDKAKSFAQHPVGSGPFILKSWDHGSKMELVRNPYYWAKGEDGKPLPYLDGVTFEIVPDDATRILKLKSGELDGAEFIPYTRAAELKTTPGIDMEMFPSTRVENVTLNVRPQLAGKANPLANLKVRQALNYAINKPAVIQIVTHGVGTQMTSFMSTATPLHAGDKPLYPYDLAKAKSLMQEAGFPKGFEANLLTLAGNQDEISVATTLQQMWAALGIKLNIVQVDNASRAQQYRDGTFQMRLSLWTDDIADPNEITSYYAYEPNIGSLHTSWKNDEVNSLFEASQKELDKAKRAAQYLRIQEIYNTTGPTIPLYETPYPVALSKKVHGFVQIPLGNNVFRAAWLSK